MFGYLEGYSDANDIHYCPSCGDLIYVRYADGTAQCGECGERFGVITVSEEEEE